MVRSFSKSEIGRRKIPPPISGFEMGGGEGGEMGVSSGWMG